jgi:hypothetical protein
LDLAVELGNIARACEVMGFARIRFTITSWLWPWPVGVLMRSLMLTARSLRNRIEEATEMVVAAFAHE